MGPLLGVRLAAHVDTWKKCAAARLNLNRLNPVVVDELTTRALTSLALLTRKKPEFRSTFFWSSVCQLQKLPKEEAQTQVSTVMKYDVTGMGHFGPAHLSKISLVIYW